MQQAYTGAHHLERSTPILGLCHDVFTERFILDYLFAGNRLLELAWVMRSMKRKEKKWRPYAGRSSYQNYVNSASLLLYSDIPILPFLIYPTIFCKFFTLAKKFAGERIIVLFLSCLHLKSLHPHSP